MTDGKILVYDFGTTSLKVSLFDESLEMVDRAESEFFYEYPRQGYVEIDPRIYWDSAVRLTVKLLEKNKAGGSVEIISLTGQAETLIPVDRHGNSIGNAIVWLDTRAEYECRYLKNSIGIQEYYHITGLNEISPVWPVNKIMWIRNNERDLYDNTCKFMLLKDYILFRLTGEMASDPTVCSWSGCFDIRKRQWSGQLLNIADIQRDKLVDVTESFRIVGFIRPEIQKIFGLKKKIGVMNGLLDQCASSIGAGNITPGDMTETTGTALVIATVVDDIDRLKLTERIPFMCHAFKNRYLALPYFNTAGIILKWFRDAFCDREVQMAKDMNIDTYAFLDEQVSGITAIDPWLVVLPYFCGLENTDSNDLRRPSGTIHGLSLSTGKMDIVKAIMECIAFLLKMSIDMLERNGFRINRVISLGGGARSNVWLQIKSDVLNRKIITFRNEESTSLGCAFMAAVAIGLYKDEGDISKIVKFKAEYSPKTENTRIYDIKYDLFVRLFDILKNIY